MQLLPIAVDEQLNKAKVGKVGGTRQRRLLGYRYQTSEVMYKRQELLAYGLLVSRFEVVTEVAKVLLARIVVLAVAIIVAMVDCNGVLLSETL